MSISFTAFTNGIRHKLKKRKAPDSFTRLTWLQKKVLKHQDDVSVKILSVGKLSFRYRRPYELLHTYKELFEDEIYRFAASNPSPFIIDCGANIGLSVAYFKSLYPHANVLAFEPDESNFELLQENVRLNNLTNVECRQNAVWVQNETLSFVSDGSQASQIAAGGESKKSVLVKAERLADVLQGKKVDFLKIDIEGAETRVIEDCVPYLKNVQNLFVEYHGKVAETGKLIALLQNLKTFSGVYVKTAADNLAYPFADKKTEGSFDVQLNIFCYSLF